MTVTLTEDERQTLEWLGRQRTPMWGGLYHPDGLSKDPKVALWCSRGWIGPVMFEPGGHNGGYVLMPSGRAALLSPEAPASSKEEAGGPL